MILALDQSPQLPHESQAESYARNSESTWVYKEKIDPEEWIAADSEIRFLSIERGNLLLRLYEPASLRLNYALKECRVEGWDICVSIYEAHTLPRQMARKFLDLFSKAEDGDLSEAEDRVWMRIVDQVDYQSFSIDRAAPQYMEGTLHRRTPVCRVEWHDGKIENLSAKAASALALLDPGEDFGAFVKLGHGNEIREIERVSKLSPA